jgi:hypothetical protein
MSKLVPTILAVATLGLGSAAFAQGSTAPSAAPTAPSTTQPKATAPSGAGTHSGAATSGKTLSETELRNELQKQGYSNVSDIKRKGDMFEARAMKDGKRVSLDVDAKTGKVVAR